MKASHHSKNRPLHKFYNFKKLITNPALYAMVITLSFLLTTTKLCAQLQKPFTLRTSQQALEGFAGKQMYTVKGDFAMLGNTNSVLSKGFMDFIRLGSDPTVLNSSSANFNLPPAINNACTKIIYAGLYWTGVIQPLPNTIDIRTVKFRTPVASYADITATEDIFLGNATNNVYVEYCDVTNLVKAGGVGAYSVANIGPNNHVVGSITGWSLVVVYENATLPLKNIGIIDGYTFLKANQNQQIDLNGFHTNQSGHVNIKLGVMAGAGNISGGDAFQIKKTNTNNWYSLSHGMNTVDDFFNGSIFTGGNNRAPTNNDNKVDIAVFNVPNDNNEILDNNQSSTSFLAKTVSDEYALYNVTFAFDAYAPQITALNKSNNNLQTNGTVIPGQDLEFELDLYNKGNEAVKNVAVEVTLPQNLIFVSSELTKGDNVILSPPEFSSIIGANKVKWNIANLELPRDPAAIVGRLKYKVKVIDDCFLLTSYINASNKDITINGNIVGTGAVSGVDFENKLTIDHISETCAESSIYEPFNLSIVVSDAFKASCPGLINGRRTFTRCVTRIPYADIASMYPPGSTFARLGPAGAPGVGIITDYFLFDPSGKPFWYVVVVPGVPNAWSFEFLTQFGNCNMMSNPMIPIKFKKP
nr:DUF11 domain-containing protein [Pedobacter sp. ASV2]